MIFSVKENTITAYGQIWDGNGMEFVSTLAQVESKFKDITIKMHTYGGSVFDGNLMANALRDSKANIRFEIVGIAASMGFVISLYLKEVYMVSNGFIMSHAPSGHTAGTAQDHDNSAKLLRSIEKTFLKNLSEKTGKTEAYVKKWLVGDNWMDADEAEKEGLIKGVIEPESDTITASLNPQELGVQGMYYQFSALLNPKNELQINLKTDMKQPIIEALGLQGVTSESSDTAIIDAVRNHFEGQISKAQSEVLAAQAKMKIAEDALTAQKTVAIAAVIEAAKKAGKITQEQVATYEGIAEASGIEVLNTVLGAIPARQTITGQFTAGKTNAPAGRENWDFDKWQKEDSKGFEALAKDEPETFKTILDAKYKK